MSRRKPQAVPLVFTKSEAACPVDGSDGKILGHSKEAEIYQCPSCKLCYLGATLRPNAYLDNQWYAGFSRHLEWGDRFLRQLRPVYSRQLGVLSGMTSGRKLADIGCGVGVFLATAKEANWDVVGIEESSSAVDFAKKAYGLQYLPKLEAVKPGSLDVIRLSHVLEHIPDPVGFLDEVKKLLKPNGILAITVPNREPLLCKVVNTVRGLFSKRPKLVGAIYPDMHVLGFSPGSLASTVKAAGFHEEQVFTVSMGSPTYFPLFYDGLLNILPISALTLKSLFKYWIPIFLNNLGNPFGRGEWVVGYFRK
jgi:SAM-dependent methyltransferase